jgi:hypothetical protein
MSTFSDEEVRIRLLGLRAVLEYFETAASTEPAFAPEAERANLLLTALESGRFSEARELLSLPMPEHYGGTGWQYVIAVAKELLDD